MWCAHGRTLGGPSGHPLPCYSVRCARYGRIRTCRGYRHPFPTTYTGSGAAHPRGQSTRTHDGSVRQVLLEFRSESHRHTNFACQRAPGCAVDRNLRCTPAAHTMADIDCPPPVLHIGSTRHAESLDGLGAAGVHTRQHERQATTPEQGNDKRATWQFVRQRIHMGSGFG